MIRDLSEFGPADFHFINMAGKQAPVLWCKQGFEWNGRAVKELAGSGAVYIRLTKYPYITSSSSSDDDELVPYLESTNTASARVSSSTSDVCSGQQVIPTVVTPRASVMPTVTSAAMPPRLPDTLTVTPAVVSPRAPPVTPDVPPRTPVRPTVTPAVVTPRVLVTPNLTPAVMPPRAPVAPPVVPPRSTVSLAVMPSASSSSVFVNGSAVTICIDDVSNNTASSATTADSCIVIDDDCSDGALDNLRDDVIELVSKSDVTN